MTSNGRRLTPEGTRVSVPQPVPLDGATATPNMRRSPLSPSRPRFMGMEVHQETMAVASSAQDSGAALTSLGPLGTRQGDSDHRVRHMPSNATPRIVVAAAGPWGAWLARSLRTNDAACVRAAPSRRPLNARDPGTPNRRDAGPRARLARAGALPAVSVPTGDDAALRARSRARAAPRRALHDAQGRRPACVLRPAGRSTGPAPGGPAPRRGLSAGVGPPPAHPIVLHA